MPSSSLSSRMSAASGVSPSWTLPPGNSHSPAIDLPSGRSASRTRPSTSISATATTRTTGLSAPIAAIDVDIAVGQIAGPHGRPPPPDAEIDLDVEIAPGHVAGDRRLVIAGHRPALLADPRAADRDHQAVAIGFLTGLADRHDDAAPIGVTGGERGLDQRRVADGEADAASGPRRGGAGDLDGDEFLGALAVADDLLREVDEHVFEGGAELLEMRIARAGDRLVAGRPGGAEEQCVAGRSIAVDGDRIERAIGTGREQRLQHRRRDLGIGEDIG